jgi:RNA polymerase sigma-70 factor (ECF subfamily)
MATALLTDVTWEHDVRMDATPLDEPDLLRRFSLGDDTAFSALVGRYQQLAWVVACRVTGREDLAADVVQEAFMRCLRHRGRFDVSKAFKPWLLQIVRNLAIDALRAQRRIEGGGSLDLVADTGTSQDPSTATQAGELRTRVAAILGLIPEKYRELLIMREMEGLAAEDIARQTGVEYGTTRWRLHEARRLFRAAWVQKYGELEGVTGDNHA